MPAKIPPFVTEREILEPFVQRLWADIENRIHGTIRFERDSRAICEIDRPDSPGLLAFDFNRSNSITQYAIVVERRNRVVLTYSVSIFELGNLDLYDYISGLGMHSDSNEFQIEEESPAYFISRGIRGRIGFMGNVWTPPDMRGGRKEIRSLISDIGGISRAINLGALNVQQSFWFVRDYHYQSGLAPMSDCRGPGVIYRGTEKVWLGYSGPSIVLKTARIA